MIIKVQRTMKNKTILWQVSYIHGKVVLTLTFKLRFLLEFLEQLLNVIQRGIANN